MNIWIVVPSFNEQQRLVETVRRIRKVVPTLPLIVVDDGSTPPEKVSVRDGIHVLRHKLNLGKGAALTTGIEYAFGHGAEAVILMDSDGQHNPAHIPEFVRLLSEGMDLVFGSRQGFSAPLIRLLGNKFAAIYINILFGVYVSDILSGFRGLSKRAYKAVKWRSMGYGVETEMVARLGKHTGQLQFTEIPIDTLYIDKYKGVSIIDAINILANSIWWKLS